MELMKQTFLMDRPARLILLIGLLALGGCGSGGGPAKTDAPAPTLSLSVAPAEVEVNGEAMLTWSATNADSCTASGGWSGQKSVAGSETTGPMTDSAAYTLQCTGAGGSASKSVNIT
ncbi:MAG: hypothetical protein KJO35_02505, partial [Gammaproteobacteria bacterium]|nr:hypothetical protein [Gammaproteobacteria bacterium]